MILKIDHNPGYAFTGQKLIQVGEQSEPKKVFCLLHLFVEGLIQSTGAALTFLWLLCFVLTPVSFRPHLLFELFQGCPDRNTSSFRSLP